MKPVVVVLPLVVATVLAPPALGQETPAEPEPPWQGEAGAGLALTSGNADTSNFNITFELTHDAQTTHVMSWNGLYLRGSNDGVTNVDRTSLGFRDEYRYSERMFFFAQLDYLRDRFKQIDYLLAPTAGVGIKLHDSETLRLATDLGLGVVMEKNPGIDLATSGAVSASESLAIDLSQHATFTQSVAALWKVDDPADGLYTFGVGLVTGITERTQLSLKVLDTFKNRPPTADVQKNDVALVTAITWTF